MLELQYAKMPVGPNLQELFGEHLVVAVPCVRGPTVNLIGTISSGFQTNGLWHRQLLCKH